MGIPKKYQAFMDTVITYMPSTRPSFEQYFVNDEIDIQNINVFELPDDLNGLYGTSTFNTARLQHFLQKDKIEARVETYFSQG